MLDFVLGRQFSSGVLPSVIGSMFAAVLFAAPAAAQPDLAITMYEAGNFAPNACSQFSPQYSNASSDPRFSYPGRCISTIGLVVSNVAAAGNPSVGTITVTDNLMTYMPKAATLVSAGGSGLNCGISGINFDVATCTTNAVIPRVQFYNPITLQVSIEDFSQPGINNLAVVSGGGDASPLNNVAFDSQTQTPPEAIVLGVQALVTVHTVPEGLTMLVDGVMVQAPHTYTWLVGDAHTITAPSAAMNGG